MSVEYEESTLRSCFAQIAIGNDINNVWINNSLGPTLKLTFQRIFDEGLKILDQVNFFKISGLDGVVASVVIGWPEYASGESKLIFSAENLYCIDYLFNEDQVPEITDYFNWHFLMLDIMNDAIMRACCYFNIKATCIKLAPPQIDSITNSIPKYTIEVPIFERYDTLLQVISGHLKLKNTKGFLKLK